MATNDFLPFAVGSSANVVSQSAYAALAALTSGYQSGVANSAQINKTFRQGSIMAAVLAQFIVNQTGQNATDDGTTATLIANLLAAVKASSNAVVGAARNVAMYLSAASASATLTADEIVVESALGGLTYRLSSFSKTINLATTGAGGMDTGTAPASGYVALYAIYNPTTGASALLASNATSAVAPNVYGGANMPSGYTASALVSVWPTNSSSQFIIGLQQDRTFSRLFVQVLSSTSVPATLTALSISSAVPPNAKSVSGSVGISTNVSANANFYVSGDANGVARKNIGATAAASFAQTSGYTVNMVTPQTVYWSANTSAGTMTSTMDVTQYTI